MAEQITEEHFQAIWGGADAATIGALSKKTPEAPPKNDLPAATPAATTTPAEPADDLDKLLHTPTPVKDDDISIAFGGGPSDDDEEDEEEEEDTRVVDEPKKREPKAPAKPEPKKAGRPNSLVATINSLVESGELYGYEEGDVKTEDEARELIRVNLKKKEEEADENAWQERVKTKYSPQVQAIIHYAENGVTDAGELLDLIGAIKDVENVNSLDPNTPEGQKEIIRKSLSSKGFKEGYVEKQVNMFADMGPDKLKEQADELYPDLVATTQKEAAERLRQKELQEKQAEEASKIYFQTIKKTLDKDDLNGVRLTKEDKAKVFQAVADYKYTSLSGKPTNLFVKTLEELQFGDKANYELYLELVHHAVDPQGFAEKLARETTNKKIAENNRKIRSSKSSSPNTEDTRSDESFSTTGKKTIKKGGFVNPFE